MPYELIPLTDDQKAIARAHYANTELGALVPLVFPGAKPDGRTTEGRSLRAFLAEENLEVKTTKWVNKEAITLNDTQKAVIVKHHDNIESTLELARLVFNDQTIKMQSREWRAVFEYRKEVYPDSIKLSEEPVDEVEYTAPKTLQQLVAVVNDYVTTGDNRNAYNINNLKASEERNLRALMSHLRNFTVRYYCTSYKLRVDRELFLSTFIRWVHTKPDLTEMEVDQMASAAAEAVNIAVIAREIEEVQEYHRGIRRGEVVKDDGKKLNYGLAQVEEINGLRQKHDQAKGRLGTLMKSLETERAKRVDAMKERNASILNLLEEWMKDEQKRKDMIEMGIAEKEEDIREVGRLRDLDDLTALVSGQSEEEAAS